MIGAHNVLSAYKPRRWWMYLGRFAHRCQRRKVGELMAIGVQFFDIRVCYRGFRAIGAHGVAEYDVDVYKVLDEISRCIMYPAVRIILEKGDDIEKKLFRSDCELWQELFPNIKFIGGNYKPTWERIVVFPYDDVRDNITQYVGSMDARRRWWGRIWPRLYARLYNDENLGKTVCRTGEYFLFDFL